MLVWLLVGITFIFMGIAVHVFKWYFLIAGYNTLPKEEKAKVDIESVARLVGFWGYVNGGLCLVLSLLAAFGVSAEKGLIPGLIVFGVSTIYIIVRSQRYGSGLSMAKGRRASRSHQRGSVAVVIVSLVVVIVMAVYFMQPTKVTIDDQGVAIHGLYGGTYAWDQIESAELVEELPRLTRRTSGATIGPHLRGYFRTAEGESVMLFVNRQLPPFIHLIAESRSVYLNLKTADDTRQAAEGIKARLGR
ncbi:MAG: DUF3784 domain-containing protein [Firmicutes bacterium]|jgi:hypothetical protein|nr:DUF3784 domain-containing protein [Bacillota bacterium]NLL87618.1 DUF3784 domain-containing protein [Bacillota bacterium]HKM17141.1 DUF3784 domain-containing protein [Limnochordia bacterium]